MLSLLKTEIDNLGITDFTVTQNTSSLTFNHPTKKITATGNNVTISDIYVNSLFIEIETKQPFSILDYSENDIIIFKNIDISNNNLKTFLERPQGHKIYYQNNFTESTRISNLPDLDHSYLLKQHHS